MTLTSAMQVGFTGIQSNTVGVDTVGDNLANLNTTGFKSQRTNFETLLYRTVSEGEAPGEETGGTLPRQIGTGSGVASIQRDFSQGGFDFTGVQSDLAVNGTGFFVVEAPTGENRFTRDGAFTLDAAQTLVNVDGLPVQAFTASADGTINVGTLDDLIIPLGSESAAVATTAVEIGGRLDPTATVASTGAISVSDALVTAGGTPATSATALTDLVDDSGLPLFAAGDILVVGGRKGGIDAAPGSFIVGTDGSTLGDLASRLEQTLGIQTDASLSGQPGVVIGDGTDFPAGSLVVRSNTGLVNAVSLDGGSIVNTTGAIASPFAFTSSQAATGEGVTTSFGVFDSLGNLNEVRMRFALEDKGEQGTTWRFYAESVDDTDLSPALGTGTISFDTNGQFVGATGTDLAIDLAGTGAASPLGFTADFSGVQGLVNPGGVSEVVMDSQNGAPPGIMEGYRVEQDGTVVGLLSNEQEQTLGQIALATFANNEGLVAEAGNLFAPAPNSGDPNIVAPITAGAGTVVSGALEQSNVEIAREFINLITHTTGISSASRVVRAADDLLQELLLLAR